MRGTGTVCCSRGNHDVYPKCNYTIQIDFFGNEVEEIKTFDPTTQRTEEKIDFIRISSSVDEEKKRHGGCFL